MVEVWKNTNNPEQKCPVTRPGLENETSRIRSMSLTGETGT